VDIRKDQIPVAPAAHYGMGGVKVDEQGQTSIENLYAVGEVVSSGIHGANRLASNSLLECVVLARRVASQIEPALVETPLEKLPPFFSGDNEFHAGKPPELAQRINRLREVMWQYVGLSRTEEGLQTALDEIEKLEKQSKAQDLFHYAPQGIEFQNMLVTSRLIAESALTRTESRGAHFRPDYPKADEHAKHSIMQKLLTPAEALPV
jgi:L-aspartate oxidase